MSAATPPQPDPAWQQRFDALWAQLGTLDDGDFVSRVDALCGELPAGTAIADYHRGSARDSTGHPKLAVPLYRAALAAGLDDSYHRQATIQLASSLRFLGEVGASIELLSMELVRTSDELDGAVAGFLALALASGGREREATSIALTALSGTMTRYGRSLEAYAADLAAPQH